MFYLIQCSTKDNMRPFFGQCSHGIDQTLKTEDNIWQIIVALVVVAIVLLAIITILIIVLKKRQRTDEIPENKSKIIALPSTASSGFQNKKGSITQDIDRLHNRFIDSEMSKESESEQLSRTKSTTVGKTSNKT